jgi:hypothetical protein
MYMKNSKQMLSSILKTTQMGQVGIRSVLDTSMRPGLRQALESQLREYDMIESEAHAIASQRGWDLEELEPAVRFFSDRMVRFKLPRGNCDSKIADLMIQSNTKAMIRGLRQLHQYPRQDDRISAVCQKLVDCQRAGIQNLQFFL